MTQELSTSISNHNIDHPNNNIEDNHSHPHPQENQLENHSLENQLLENQLLENQVDTQQQVISDTLFTQPESAIITTPSGTRRHAPKLEELEFRQVIGEGAYGSVRLALDTLGRRYAVKILEKGKVVRRNEIESVFREKMILSRLVHPAIVRLYATAQDAEFLYFVLELCERGEMFYQIKRVGRFDEECARFYTAEILTGLEHIHALGIVHRDIKPENVLLDQHGHAKITDFGSAKDMQQGQESARTSDEMVNSSFVGTSHYLSPELLNDDKVSGRSDLWALGCVLYQMLVGRPPFNGPTDYAIFVQIRENRVTFPPFISDLAQDLIRSLLHHDAEQRATAEHVRKHPWFSGFDWDTLHARAPPPIRAPVTFSEFEEEERGREGPTSSTTTSAALASSRGGALQQQRPGASSHAGLPVISASQLSLRLSISSHENVSSGFRPYTNYTIELHWPHRAQHWRIVQRYSDLLQFHQQLLKSGVDPTLIPRFPGKKFINQMDPAFIEQRKKHLSNYLRALFTVPRVLSISFVQERFSFPQELIDCYLTIPLGL